MSESELTYELNWANELDQRRFVKTLKSEDNQRRMLDPFTTILLSIKGGYEGVREATAKYGQFASRWKTPVPVIITQKVTHPQTLMITYGDMVTWTIKVHRDENEIDYAVKATTVLDAEHWAIQYRDSVLIGDCSLLDLASHAFLTSLVGFLMGYLDQMGAMLIVRTTGDRHYLFAGDHLLYEVSGKKEEGHPKYGKEK